MNGGWLISWGICWVIIGNYRGLYQGNILSWGLMMSSWIILPNMEFPSNGGFHSHGGILKQLVCFMENPMKMDDWGVALFQETSKSLFENWNLEFENHLENGFGIGQIVFCFFSRLSPWSFGGRQCSKSLPVLGL